MRMPRRQLLSLLALENPQRAFGSEIRVLQQCQTSGPLGCSQRSPNCWTESSPKRSIDVA